MSSRRAVITGIGFATPIGVGGSEVFESLCDGAVGERVNWADTWCYVAKSLDAGAAMGSSALAKRTARATHLVVAAFEHALASSGLDPTATDPTRAGVILGTAVGGLGEAVDAGVELLETGRTPSKFLVPGIMLTGPNGFISIKTGFSGANYVLSSACSSSSHALGTALREIRDGVCDVVVTGGFESPYSGLEGTRRDVIGLGFSVTGALSPSGIVRPFAADRDGFLMGEGACLMVLEELEHARARGATPIAELAGFGRSSDGFHMVAPHPDGEGAKRAMEMALRDADIAPGEVGLVHAHATGTPAGDIAEANGLATVFGGSDRVPPTTSTKAATGHALGAAGAYGAATCALAIQTGRIPPTLNAAAVDPEIPIDVVRESRDDTGTRVALTNAFAFGGTNGALVLRAV